MILVELAKKSYRVRFLKNRVRTRKGEREKEGEKATSFHPAFA